MESFLQECEGRDMKIIPFFAKSLGACAAMLSWAVVPLAGQPGGGGISPFVSTTIAPSFTDLDYVGNGNARQMLDLWVPQGDGPFPLIVWIHGGAFRGGSKASPPPFPDRLMPRGFAYASIGYRLSTEAQWPAQILDVKAAVRFLRANAEKYKLDANRFGAVGASAGSHLAAMLGTSGGVTIWDTADMPNAGVSSRVQAVVDQFGPLDFGQMDAMQMPSCSAGTTNTAASPETGLLGCTIGTCPEKTIEASPITYVDGNTPPFLLAHGSNDCNISPEQSRLMAETLVRAGHRPIFRVIPGAGHGGTQFDNAAYLSLVDSFFVRTLKGGSALTLDAAEYQNAAVAPGQLITLFGQALTGASAMARSQPWPTSLAGVRVAVKDAQGKEQNAGLVFVAPDQINAQLPAGVAVGEATLTVLRDGEALLQDQVQVLASMPTLFSQTVDGLSRPVGEMVYKDAAGTEVITPLLSSDAGGAPIIGRLRFSGTTGPISVVLYGTGLNATEPTITARVADVAATVVSSGAQGFVQGLDVYKVEIPRTLAGRGEVTLSMLVNGIPATAVRLSID
jgi:uncharacterized protein (TIGR03437 family)